MATLGGKIPLGELLPVLEALGLTVMEEVPTRLDGGDDGAYLHDFGVLVDDAQLDCERDGERLAEAITAVWSGRCESDTLNALVVRAGLRVDDVVILRAYRRYRRIVAPTFTAAYQNDVLCAHPKHGALARRAVPRALLRARRTRRARRSCARELEEQLAAVGQSRRGPHPARLRRAHRRHRAHERGARPPATSRSSCARPTCRRCPRPRRSSRSSSTTRWSRASTCAAATSRAAASAGRIAARTTAPRCSG